MMESVPGARCPVPGARCPVPPVPPVPVVPVVGMLWGWMMSWTRR